MQKILDSVVEPNPRTQVIEEESLDYEQVREKIVEIMKNYQYLKALTANPPSTDLRFVVDFPQDSFELGDIIVQ